jgi:M6 family metalloprotease-like protein
MEFDPFLHMILRFAGKFGSNRRKRGGKMKILIFLFLFPMWVETAGAIDFLCAGLPAEMEIPRDSRKAAKLAQIRTEGTRHALVIFAQFRDEESGWEKLPSWSRDIFNPELPGSFSHFYDTMSFGKLRVRGEIAPQIYRSLQSAPAYLTGDPTENGEYGRFALEILEKVDQDIDFSQFDNDGADGIPNTGDDDGIVDALFLVIASAPRNFLLGNATGVGGLGLEQDQITNDLSFGGNRIRIAANKGTIQRGRNFSETIGSMCHEYGHVLGLLDLYDTAFLRKRDAAPEEDSAGIGAWGLMGWGALGWSGNDGPNSFCAWSRMRLGWVQVAEPDQMEQEIELGDVGLTGQIYHIPVGEDEAFLLENRRRKDNYYDHHIPGEGLLIWHVGYESLPRFRVDLECADGQWADAGFPGGNRPDARYGGDNLDFWAHDQVYTRQHYGNRGDATDPFDGVRFTSFTPESNPNALTHDGRALVHMENLRFEEGQGYMRVRMEGPRIEVDALELADADRDGVMIEGENAELRFKISNQGGLPCSGVNALLSADSQLVEIGQREVHFGALSVGQATGEPIGGWPQLVLKQAFEGNQQIELRLDFSVDGEPIGQHAFTIDAVSTYRLSGRVTGERGESLAELGLSARAVSEDRSGYLAKTDLEGFYTLDLPPGQYVIVVSPGEGLALPGAVFSQSMLSHVQRDVILRQPVPVRGVVRDPEGDPIADISIGAILAGIDIFVGFMRVETAGDGTFEMELRPGNYLFRMENRSSDPLLDFPPQYKNVKVEKEEWVEFALQRGVQLTIQVVDENSQGMGPATLQMGKAATPDGWSWVTTDKQGTAVVDLTPGVYEAALIDVKSPYIGTKKFPLPVNADTSIQIVASRGVAVTGRVRDSSPIGILTGQFSFVPLAGGPRVVPEMASDGSFAALLPPGRFEASFISIGRRLSPSQTLGAIEIDGEQTLDFALQAGIRKLGQLLDADGKGVGGVEIQAFSASGRMAASGSTGPEGIFQLYLNPDRYELVAVVPSVESSTAPGERVSIGGGTSFWNLGAVDVDLLEPLVLRLPEKVGLHGQVIDADRQPVEEALVVLTCDPRAPVMIDQPDSRLAVRNVYKQGEAFEAAALTDEMGYYELDAISGTYAAVILPGVSGGTGTVVEGISLPTDNDIDFILPFREKHSLYGEIIYERDLPQGRVLLQFYDEHKLIFAQQENVATGGYTIDLSPGSYQVRAALIAPTGGFLRIYEAGRLSVVKEQRWDVDLTGNPTVVREERNTEPVRSILAQNYPNPLNAETTIAYQLSERGSVQLVIYNVMGQRVKMLVDESQDIGKYQINWDGTNEAGRPVASGVYFYRLSTDTQVLSKRMVLVE